MKLSSEKVLHYLTGHNDINAVTIEELQRLAEESPYFPVTRFLLAKKLKAENATSFLEEVQKTALYYSNPHWLHYQLMNGEVVSSGGQVLESDTAMPDDKSSLALSAGNDEPRAVTWPVSEIAEDHPITTEFSSNEIEAASELAHETLHEEEPSEQDEPLNEVTSQAEEEAATLARDTDENTFRSLNEVVTAEEPVIRDQFEQVVLDSLTPAKQEEIVAVFEEMAGASRETDATTEEFLAETTATSEETIEEQTILLQENQEADTPTTALKETEEPDEHEKMFQNIKAMLDASSEEADADVEDAVIPIDPYYTIDYFASQGIRLELEQNPQDQLGKNLKKFTQWLKHMKKLGPEDATEVIIKKETEADIVKIADSSNTAREVVTEAMASVLEKQGKKDKAIELYNKLSFLNPGKSAYFAHKIKNLNGT